MEQQDGARAAYLRFAEDEVRDKSPLYGEVLRGVASDPATHPAVVPTFGGPPQRYQTLRPFKVLESAKLG
jgi:hypothetical protein